MLLDQFQDAAVHGATLKDCLNLIVVLGLDGHVVNRNKELVEVQQEEPIHRLLICSQPTSDFAPLVTQIHVG